MNKIPRAGRKQNKAFPENTAACVICNECGRQFKRKDHLKDHLEKIHSPDKKTYDCSLCSMTTAYPQNWKIHMQRAHKWTEKAATTQLAEIKNEKIESTKITHDKNVDRRRNKSKNTTQRVNTSQRVNTKTKSVRNIGAENSEVLMSTETIHIPPKRNAEPKQRRSQRLAKKPKLMSVAKNDDYRYGKRMNDILELNKISNSLSSTIIFNRNKRVVNSSSRKSYAIN